MKVTSCSPLINYTIFCKTINKKIHNISYNLFENTSDLRNDFLWRFWSACFRWNCKTRWIFARRSLYQLMTCVCWFEAALTQDKPFGGNFDAPLPGQISLYRASLSRMVLVELREKLFPVICLAGFKTEDS